MATRPDRIGATHDGRHQGRRKGLETKGKTLWFPSYRRGRITYGSRPCVWPAALLLTLALRRNRAALRYWIWFLDSLKLLIPFSVLAAIGSGFGYRTAPELPKPQSLARWLTLITRVSRPFAAQSPARLAGALPVEHLVLSVEAILGAVWLWGFLATVAFGFATGEGSGGFSDMELRCRLDWQLRLCLPCPQ
jgi:hypothetical protein